MTFEEFWAEVEKLRVLPDAAIRQIPLSLSNDAKKKLMNAGPKEAARVLQEAIDQINGGSIESIDSIVKRVCI